MDYRLGIDLGGTKTEIVALDPAYEVLLRKRVATPAHSYTEILGMVERLVTWAEGELGQRASVGIGMPGALSPRSGKLRNSNTACLNGKPFLRDASERLGRDIRIENDANCLALSESLTGAATGEQIVFGVIVGTGTGGALVIDGKLVNGPHAITGEWGHNPLPWHRPEDGEPACYCGKRACIETFLSGPGMMHGFAARFGESRRSEEIVAGADAGDESCAAMLETYHDQMARALAHVINIVDPHVIVLGGGMSNIESIYRAVPRRLPDYVFSDFVATRILRAAHGDSSGVLGAALLWESERQGE